MSKKVKEKETAPGSEPEAVKKRISAVEDGEIIAEFFTAFTEAFAKVLDKYNEVDWNSAGTMDERFYIVKVNKAQKKSLVINISCNMVKR